MAKGKGQFNLARNTFRLLRLKIRMKLMFWLAVIGLIIAVLAGLMLVVFSFITIVVTMVSSASIASVNEQEMELTGGNICIQVRDVNEEQWNHFFDKEIFAGAFLGQGDLFLEVAERYGIDPVLLAGIASHETGYGTSSALVNKNNPGGVMDPETNWQVVKTFDTLEDGLDAMAKILHRMVIKEGRKTLEEIGSVYAPVGAENDPHNQNQYWVPNVGVMMEDLGGETMECSSVVDLEFNFSSENISELRESIATVGGVWVGNAPYFWGGGRNQASANRGEFDCSSFVHWAYAQNGITLGHISGVNTETLKTMGTKIALDEIQVGDLIFWDTYKVDGHVAIYIGGGKFIGSQSSTGVAIEYMSSSYWTSVFKGHVRRVITESDESDE